MNGSALPFHDAQDDEFTVADPGLDSGPPSVRDEFGVGVEVVIGGDVECCCESV